MSLDSTMTPPPQRAHNQSTRQSTRQPTRQPNGQPNGLKHRSASTWVKRLIVVFLVFANVAVFAVYWTLRSAQDAFRDNATQLEEVVPELTLRPTESADPLVFLVIGSDTRAGLESLQNFGESAGARGDVIMLIKLYPADGHVQILSLPRDLLVEIPGKGTDRINAAYAVGGAPLMVRTVKQVTGLPVHHYIEVDFVGFQSLVDDIGGVYLDFPYPARDANSGLSVDAGYQLLDGSQALAYARSRHYQELRDGDWVSVDADDIGRTGRQQNLILAILGAVKTPSSLTEAGSIVGGFARHLTVDSAFARSSLVELAFRMRSISAQKIETATLPVYLDTYNEMSIVRMQHPEADDVIAHFASGQPMTAVIEDEPLRLQVLNGNGTKGSAGRWSDILEDEGFEVLAVGDADRSDFEITKVLVRPGGLLAGQAIVDALGFGEVSTGSLDSEVDAVVIVGLDADRTAQNG
jgi:polyisoprenyl-teichoic acid--peptidoglycan teichoic acid transferase